MRWDIAVPYACRCPTHPLYTIILQYIFHNILLIHPEKSVQHTISKHKNSRNKSGKKQALIKMIVYEQCYPLSFAKPIRLVRPFSRFLNAPVSRSRGWEMQTPASCTARGGRTSRSPRHRSGCHASAAPARATRAPLRLPWPC